MQHIKAGDLVRVTKPSKASEEIDEVLTMDFDKRANDVGQVSAVMPSAWGVFVRVQLASPNWGVLTTHVVNVAAL